MAQADLTDWLDEWSRTDSVWYLKRLSANDTQETGAHGAGPYLSKDVLFRAFPALDDRNRKNPEVLVDAAIDSHGDRRDVRAVWYNNRYFGGTRNEARITNWGGNESALLKPDSTGALTVFVFVPAAAGPAPQLRVWVCRNPVEEDLVESTIANVEPGEPVIWSPRALDDLLLVRRKPAGAATCVLSANQLPEDWRTSFPTASEIVQKVMELCPVPGEVPDDRLLRRRACEYELFQSVEDAVEGNVIRTGFQSVAEFLTHAQRLLQRRKARSGKSLELQTKAILVEEGLEERRDFSHNAESEPGKRPDFLFPSAGAYKNPNFPGDHLLMLAVKTTCKDRWRQILNEADRIGTKHLLTLQEGVSVGQHDEMAAAGVRLVVPARLVPKYPQAIRRDLTTLGAFITLVLMGRNTSDPSASVDG